MKQRVCSQSFLEGFLEESSNTCRPFPGLLSKSFHARSHRTSDNELCQMFPNICPEVSFARLPHRSGRLRTWVSIESPRWKVPTFSYFSGFFLLFPTLGSNSYFFLLFHIFQFSFKGSTWVVVGC